MDDSKSSRLRQLWHRLRSPEGFIATAVFLWSAGARILDMIGEIQTSASLWPWIKSSAVLLYHASASGWVNSAMMIGGLALMWDAVRRSKSSELPTPSDAATMLGAKLLKNGAMIARCPIHSNSTIAYSGVQIKYMCWSNAPFEVNRECSLQAVLQAHEKSPTDLTPSDDMV